MAQAAGEQVVDDNHGPAFGQQGIAEMRAQESSAAGDQRALLGSCFLAVPQAQHGGGNAVGIRGGAAHAVVGEAVRRHHFGIIQVAAIDHDGILEFLAQAVEIELGELLPLGEDQQRIGAAGGFVRRS